MSNNATPCVRTCDTAANKIRAKYDTGTWSWRKIAQGKAGAKYKGIPPGTLCAIYNGAPIPKKWHEQLGIPPEVTITPVNGSHIPKGSQVLMARICPDDRGKDCGNQPLIPNHWKRERCYTCSPYRGRKP